MIYWTQPQFEFARYTTSDMIMSMYQDSAMRFRSATRTPDTRGPELSTLAATPTADQVQNPQIASNSLRRLSAAEKARNTIHDADHNHTVNMAHTHTAAEAGKGKAFSIEPPYYELVFIMRVS